MEKGLRESSAEQTSFFLPAAHVDRKSDQITEEKQKESFQATAGVVSTLGDTQEVVHHHARSSPRLKVSHQQPFPQQPEINCAWAAEVPLIPSSNSRCTPNSFTLLR